MPNNFVIRLSFSLVLVLLQCACAGSPTGAPEPATRTTTGFQLVMLPDSFIDGGSIDAAWLATTAAAEGTTVMVMVRGARGLKALFCEVTYDPRQFSLTTASPSRAWGGATEPLCLVQPVSRGRVDYGQVLTRWDRRGGFTGDGAVATLRFTRQPQISTARSACTVPTAAASQVPLNWNRATGTLSWRYYHQGDYNQDGLVTVSDLTPLGIYYDTAGPFDPDSAIACVDGNSDGYITVSDITPIGMNYNSHVGAYRVFSSDDPDRDYPAAAATPSTIEARTELPFNGAAQGDKTSERLQFSYAVSAPVAGDAYWVRPVEGTSEGIASTLASDEHWRQWRTAKVDSADDVGYYCSLALDAADLPHICYYDNDHGDLKYAHFNGLNWQSEVVDSEHNTGWFCALALDSAGVAHISYRDDTAHVLKYARRTETGWAIEIVDNNGNVGQFTDIAIDSSDHPCISYCDEYPTGNLKYCRFDGAAWQIQVVDDSQQVQGTTGLALDSQDFPHISYYRPEQLVYTFWDGSQWSSEIVRWWNVGQYSSITLDSQDHPHLTCFHSWEREPKYSMFDGTEWHHSAISTGGDLGWFTSVVVDAADRPHVAYAEGAKGDLYYSYLSTESGWVTEQVQQQGDVGYYASLVLDSTGAPHIAYLDNGEGDLLYATP